MERCEMRESTFTNAICKAESKQISKDFAYCEDALGRAENAIGNLPFVQPEKRTEKRTETHACDLIDRQAAMIVIENSGLDDDSKDTVVRVLEQLSPAQPDQDREFIKLTVRNSNGRPYYSIIYLEVDDNGVGRDFEGYSSYSLDVISDYLKKYFMPSAQPERLTDYNFEESCTDCPAYDTENHRCPRFNQVIRMALKDANLEACEDCISRQAAIDALADMHCKSDEDGYVWIIRSDAWARIDALPSVTPKQRWIPCSERLPEHRLYVLVTYKYEYGLIDNGITWYSETENKWNTSREVIAWMPLPEPWRGEQE